MNGHSVPPSDFKPYTLLRDTDDTPTHIHTPETDAPKPSLKDMIREAFQREAITMDDLSPYRVVVGWRIVRFIMGMAGAELEPLDDFDRSATYNQMPTTTPGTDPIDQTVDPWTTLLNIQWPKSSVYSYAAFVRETAIYQTTLLPPHPPDPNTATPQDLVEHEQRLHDYLVVVERAIALLGITHGSPAEPTYGRWGKIGMDNPQTINLVFPTRVEIMLFETELMDACKAILTGEHLINNTLDMNYATGTMGVVAYLQHQYGLTRSEIHPLIERVKQYIKALSSSDTDTERGVMVLRLESIISRARSSMNFREELAGMKQLSLILGLTKSEESNFETEAAKIIRELEGSAPGMAAIPERVLKNLPPPAENYQRLREITDKAIADALDR